MTVDLLKLIGADSPNLYRHSGTNGGEWHGPCPWCGGKDRFLVQPYAGKNGLWTCRQCDDPSKPWHGPAEYLIRKTGCSLDDALQQLGLKNGQQPKPQEDPQTYPDKHGCTWTDFGKWGARLETWLDYTKNKPTSGKVFDAIFFPDATGGRYRIFNHPSKFMPANANQPATLYGVDEAVQLANTTGRDTLYLVNGQPSVIACHAHGVPAFTVPGGENGIAGHLEKSLLPILLAFWSGKIRVVLDGDKTGYQSAPKVVDVLKQAGYPDVAALDPGKGYDAADLCVHHNSSSPAGFASLPLLYPLPTPPRGAVSASVTRFQIDVTGRDMVDLLQPTWDAVVALNNPPTLFRQDGTLVLLNVTDGRARLETVNQARMRGIVSRAVVYAEQKRQGTVPWLKPEGAIVDDMLVNIDPRVQPIDRIVQVPVFAPDGSLLDSPGYHPQARLYYHPRPGLVIPSIPDQPTPQDLQQALTLIYDDLLIDFPFVDDADRTHAIALMLLPYVREMIDGPTPLHLVEAPTAGTGKGRLLEVLLIPAIGREPATTSEANTDDEWRKKLTAALAKVPEVMLLDNLNHTLDSGALSNVLTTTRWQDRLLGTSTTIDAPIRCVWAATANNMTMSKELARRSIRIRMDAKVENPQLRSNFKHDPIKSWVYQHQGELIAACLTIVRYGLQHGTPGRHLGSYEQWSKVMGKIFDGCGVKGFLGNLQALYDKADAETAAWRSLIRIWWAGFADDPVGVRQIYDQIPDDTDLPIRGKDENGRRASFGKLLAKKADNVIWDKQIIYAGTVNGSVQWRLQPVTTTP